MSYREFYDWCEYYNLEPFFADRIETQLATVCTMIAGFGKSKSKHSDFMVQKAEKQALTQEEKNKQLITAFESL